MRPRTACTSCRKRQRRCVVPNNATDTACEFCVRNKTECSLLPATETVQNPEPLPLPGHTVSGYSATPSELLGIPGSGAGAGHSSVDLPPLDACIEIASAYFIYIHEPSHNIFHRPSFMSDLFSHSISSPVLFSVLAIAARFSKHAFFDGIQPRYRGHVYAREAEKQLDLHSMSLTTLQTALLLGAYYGAEGDSLHENLYYSVACRMASLLDVPKCFSDTPLNREIGIRLWWTLDMVDVWSSNSVRLPRILPPENGVPLPSSETEFLRLRRTHGFHDTSVSTPQAHGSESILVQKILLNSLLSDIAELNKALADGKLTNHEIQMATEELARRLDTWQQQLPDTLLSNPENLIAQAASGSGGALVALHIGFYHFSQLLYYQYLHQSLNLELSSSPMFAGVHVYAERCRESSTALCELIYRAQTLPGTEVYYSMVGHVLVISSTVQLHIVLFSNDEAEINSARQRLERNFVILLNLQNLWRNIDHSVGRLKEFHEACMRAKSNKANTPGSGSSFENPTSTTFRFNKWMMGFLMEFSKPVEQRIETGTQTPDGATDNWQDSEAMGEVVQQELRRWTFEELGIDLDS